jgi:hypothetical protein
MNLRELETKVGLAKKSTEMQESHTLTHRHYTSQKTFEEPQEIYYQPENATGENTRKITVLRTHANFLPVCLYVRMQVIIYSSRCYQPLHFILH